MKLPEHAFEIARGRWPQITPDTRVVRTDRNFLVVPILVKDERAIMERWQIENALWPSFDQEEIELDMTVNLWPLMRMGYGPRTDTLAIRVVT